MCWEENGFDIRNENCIKHNWRKFQRYEAELGSVIYASADYARELKEIMSLALLLYHKYSASFAASKVHTSEV